MRRTAQARLPSRRRFLAAGLSAGIAVWMAPGLSARADTAVPLRGATAITQVFGEGQKLTAIALAYDADIDTSSLGPASYRVDGRTITRVYANTQAATAEQGRNGRFVIVELSPDDPQALLYVQDKRTITRKPAKATITQMAPVLSADQRRLAPSAQAVQTNAVIDQVVDGFRPLAYVDARTGGSLKYNLFVPRNHDPAKRYPLVLFMHDAGASSTVTDTTLVQGLGAVCWASPADQARREAFVLAPQYPEPIVNDRSEATEYLDLTVDLVHQLADQYNIDKNRIYATGQSGGAMMAIAMNIKYPDLFAASFLVAGQWDPALVKPLARQKLWIVVSQGDPKAYPGQNAITAVLEQAGAKVARAVWNGRSTPAEFAAAVRQLEAQGATIHYVALEKGSVVPPGQTDDAGSHHVNTWRIAYGIEGIRDWMFRQRR